MHRDVYLSFANLGTVPIFTRVVGFLFLEARAHNTDVVFPHPAKGGFYVD